MSSSYALSPRRRTCVRRVYSYRTGGIKINNPKALAQTRKSSESFKPSVFQSCPLLARLPLEIRSQVWRYVLGDKVFHIELRPGHLASRICSKCEERDGWCHAIWHIENTDKEAYFERKFGVTALPRVCRQVYCETIDVLYAANIIDISDLGVLKYFIQGVPPQRLPLIQTLRVHWQDRSWFPRWPTAHADFGGTWEMFWRVALDELTGLKKIDIMMCSADSENCMPEEATLSLSSLKEFREWDFRWEVDVKSRCRMVQGTKKFFHVFHYMGDVFIKYVTQFKTVNVCDNSSYINSDESPTEYNHSQKFESEMEQLELPR
ncbi:MAG: hypothetical protein Q9188_000358 [Gyalolechia gomerana]